MKAMGPPRLRHPRATEQADINPVALRPRLTPNGCGTMPYHYIYIGPFEKGAVKRRRHWVAVSRAILAIERRYKIFAAWNEDLMHDHFLLLLCSPHVPDTHDGELNLLRDALDALDALQGHREGYEVSSLPSMFVLPSFGDDVVREPPRFYRMKRAEREKAASQNSPPP
ncbi:uncharacterized protein KD926_003437 [Aspergillus affinis]|uniref:uncharacterized protein n=1 Tax=Aspergillus affinis TaxID=1070780 RepID=UPI0022FE0771|nr:uncharacterized protein KD926_003437 [Aspergillus affinis]KAI9035509.1 hypothetical protein KD926_003437 [Aspergillus affinis]